MPPENEPNTPAGGNDAGGAPKVVAQDVFNRVVEAKNGLETQVRTLQAENQKLVEKAATADNLTSQVNEWKGKHATAEAKFSTFTQLSAALATTETDVIDNFEAKYQALPKDGRPDRKVWVDGLKAKPEEAPAVLRPWLAPATATAPATRTAPKVPGTQATPPGATAPANAADVRAIREKAVKTGDWTEWKAWTKANLGK